MIQKRTTKDGKTRYLVRVRTGKKPGGQPDFAFDTRATRQQAKARETELLQSVNTGTYVKPTNERLGELLTTWVEGAAGLTARARTVSDYRELIARYIARHPIAQVEVHKLAVDGVERFYGELRGRGLSIRTVRMVHAVLRRALGKAVKARRLPANPAAGIELAEEHEREDATILDGAQIERLLAASYVTGNRLHALWHVLANGGLRPSEALGLTWDEVAFDRDEVSVRRTLVVPRKGGGWSLTPPKTKKSRRTVTLPPETMEALRWHQAQQAIEREAAGSKWTDHGFVFASQSGGPLSLPNLTVRHFKPLLKAYYPLPDIRLYDLRHSHASLALSNGVPVHVVSKRLGHANTAMTLNVYAHAVPGQDADAVETMRVRRQELRARVATR